MLSAIVSSLSRKFLRTRHLYVLFRLNGNGLGDMLIMTAVMRLIHQATGRRFIILTKKPEIFAHNPLVARVIPISGPLIKPFAKWFVRNIHHDHIGECCWRPGQPITPEIIQQDHRRPVHLAQLNSEHLGLNLDYGKIACEIYLSEEEIQAWNRKYQDLPQNFAIIKPTGRTDWTPNKEWGVENYQAVVNALPQVPWIQVGETKDECLSNVLDWRGKTSVRELFYLIKRARFILAVEGLYNHAASAFGTPSFVVFSGIHLPEIACYANTRLIVRTPQVPCAPCMLPTPCPVPGKPCTGDILPEAVIQRIQTFLDEAPKDGH